MHPERDSYCRNGSSLAPRYEQYRPSAVLRDFVEVIWVQDCGPCAEVTPSNVVPTGRVELIFHFGDPFLQLIGNRKHVMARCHVVGQRKKPILLQSTGRTGIVIVRFRPWGAPALMGELLPELNERLVDLELIWGKQVVEDLTCRLYSAQSGSARARIVDSFLQSRIGNASVDRLSQASIGAINNGWGRETIESIARRFDLGRRQFNRRFTRSVGASPKQLSQVLRAQKAVACLRNGMGVLDVVERCGFTDQSHLIRDVVKHSDRRPGELKRMTGSAAGKFFNSSELSAFCGTTYL